MQYKIPQNVQLEDKIFSFLTMKQLIICTVGGGFAYIVYAILGKSYFIEIWGIPVFLIAGTTAAVAFLEINGIPFTKYVLLALEYTKNPPLRRWDKRETATALFAASILENSQQKNDQKKGAYEAQKPSLSALEELSQKLDGTPLPPPHPLDAVPDAELPLATALGEEYDTKAHAARLDAIDDQRRHEALIAVALPKAEIEVSAVEASRLEHIPSIEDLFSVAPSVEPLPHFTPTIDTPQSADLCEELIVEVEKMASENEKPTINTLVSEVLDRVEIEKKPPQRMEKLHQSDKNRVPLSKQNNRSSVAKNHTENQKRKRTPQPSKQPINTVKKPIVPDHLRSVKPKNIDSIRETENTKTEEKYFEKKNVPTNFETKTPEIAQQEPVSVSSPQNQIDLTPQQNGLSGSVQF